MKKILCSVLFQSYHKAPGEDHLDQPLIHEGPQNVDMLHDTVFVFIIFIFV